MPCPHARRQTHRISSSVISKWSPQNFKEWFKGVALETGKKNKNQEYSVLGKDRCWRWSSNTLATWGEELTHRKRPWCWGRLRAGGEGVDRGWDGWMASAIQWTWVCVCSGRWWRTGKPGVLQSVGSERVWHDWATERKKSEGVPTISQVLNRSQSPSICTNRKRAALNTHIIPRPHNRVGKALDTGTQQAEPAQDLQIHGAENSQHHQQWGGTDVPETLGSCYLSETEGTGSGLFTSGLLALFFFCVLSGRFFIAAIPSLGLP